MHAFARLSRPFQWAVAIGLALLGLAVIGAWFALPVLDVRWLPVSLLGLPLLPPLESLLLAPLYGLAGHFRYYSPMLLATRRRSGGLDLHVGTLFDYVMRLRWSDRGPRAARIVTADVLHGLLRITEEVERGTLSPDAELAATSYFFSDRSIARLGFRLRPAPGAVVVNLAVASLSIALRLSFTRGRFAYPDLRRIRQAVTSAGELAQHASEMRRLLEQLRPAVPRPGAASASGSSHGV